MKKTRKILFTTLMMLLAMSSSLMAQNYSGGAGTSGVPYQIGNLTDLQYLSEHSGEWSKHFIQTADIDASGTSSWNSGAGFSPIGNNTTKFTGEYDGDGYTIDNLYISRPAIDYIGLFGYTNGATITDLGVTNVDITGDDKVGGLVGYNNASAVSNSYSTGSVTGSLDQVGGLVGSNYSIVRNSYSTGSVGGRYYVGGLMGRNDNSSTVENSYSTGSVSGNLYVGGLVGYNNISTVSNSFWDTETSGTETGIGGGTTTGATGKTTAQMKTLATFTDAGWDFEIETTNGTNDYWDIDGTNSINNGYPFLSWQNGEDVSLPVELTSFTADNSRAGEITIHWVTESEIENLGFLLERRAESEDGSTAEWTEIASYITDEALRGQGSVTYRTEYSFTDKTVEPGETYDYRLADVSYAGEKVYHALNVLGVAVAEIPEEFALLLAYPNPFNPATTISYNLIEDGNVTLTIFDINGREVSRLVEEMQSSGEYELFWDASHVSSGVYFCRLVQRNQTATQKLIFLK